MPSGYTSISVVRPDGTDDAAGHIAFWAFVAITLVIPVGAIGFFEGGCNHALKDALYFARSRGGSSGARRQIRAAGRLPDCD